ncbi:GTP-binding protein [Candidatus Shapirobacteria bacterium]|jgi:translation initiation factor IF-2|nr:GTP-binding protein [Candidatus Shapirobacteria bacterium]
MTTNSANKFRPPIVAVMGHIDHGKTTLLDRIRNAHVAERESGGITQHITSYQSEVKLKNGKSGLITFIDTPGHAAFCAMRTRGAQATDLVVLVISATDGVMAQTKESIKEIKKANLPVIVALTKYDLETRQPEMVKGQLVEMDLVPEEYGGQIAVIPVSAKTGSGIDELLENILLNAEIMELKNEPEAPLEAFVVESKLDTNRGPVAAVIVKKGTLRLGDQIYAENISGKVKALLDSNGKNIKEAGPSTPVEILGFEKVPCVGALISDHPQNIVSEKITPPTFDPDIPRLNVVIKADVEGTLEALKNSLSDDVNLIYTGVGPVNDNDIIAAKTSQAQLFAFNVPISKTIKNLADNEKVSIFESKIIYEIIENIQAQVLKMLDPTIEDTILGEGTIIAEFKIEKVRIAGVKIVKGEMSKGDTIHLMREGKIIKNTQIEGIRQGKDVVEKIKSDHDCGMTFRPYVDFKIGDVIIAYKNSK